MRSIQPCKKLMGMEGVLPPHISGGAEVVEGEVSCALLAFAIKIPGYLEYEISCITAETWDWLGDRARLC